MKTLIVDDDFLNRQILLRILEKHARCDVAVDGAEALFAFERALDAGEPYELILLDIMMPNMDGQEALQQIRDIESRRKIRPGDEVKVIMTTALDDSKNVVQAFFQGQATGYLTKPIDRAQLIEEVRKLGFGL